MSPTVRSPSFRSVSVGLLRLVLPVACLALLWRFADGPAVLDRLARSDWHWLLAALLMTSLQTVLSALRWRLTAGRLGQPIPARSAIAEYYLAQLINQTIPGGVLGDAARAMRARQDSLATSALAVVIERLCGQAVLFAVTLAGVCGVLVSSGWPDWVGRPGPGLALAFAACALVLVAVLRLWPRAGPALWRALRVAVFARGVWPRQVALGLGIVACNLLTFAFAAQATGTALTPGTVVTLVPLVLTAMLVPLSLAGWGLREGAAAALLPLAGVPVEAAIAASLAFGAVILVGSLPGAVVLARGRRTSAVPQR